MPQLTRFMLTFPCMWASQQPFLMMPSHPHCLFLGVCSKACQAKEKK